jgi:hypothetical protein
MLANHQAPASNDSPSGDSDYDSILAALMQTARGRAFLHDYALRHRAADTATLLTAIGRIEGLLTSRSLEPVEPPPANDTQPSDAAEAAQETYVEAVAAERLEIEAVVEAGVEIEAPAEGAIEFDVMMDEVVAIVESPVADMAEVEAVAIEVFEVGTIPPGVPALGVSAIEFLGPELSQAAMPPAPQPVRPQREARDPFADFRALSDEEKIALFA